MLPVLRRLPAYSKLAWMLIKEPRLRRRYKLLVVGGIGYLLSPVDLIPGFIPVLGQLDDLSVALWSLRTALRAAPPDVAAAHLSAHGLSWEQLDDDILRLRHTGLRLARGALRFGIRSMSAGARAVGRVIGAIVRR